MKLLIILFFVAVMAVSYAEEGQEDICLEPLEPGIGNIFFRRFYGYDSSKVQCVRFVFSDLRSSDNFFPTKRQCQEACAPKYGYDSSKGECVLYPISELESNRNFFFTKQKCEEANLPK